MISPRPEAVRDIQTFKVLTMGNSRILRVSGEDTSLSRNEILRTLPSILVSRVQDRLYWKLDTSLLEGADRWDYLALYPLISALSAEANRQVLWGFNAFRCGELDSVLLLSAQPDEVPAQVAEAARQRFLTVYPEGEREVWTLFSESARDTGTCGRIPLDYQAAGESLGEAAAVFFSGVFPGFLKNLQEGLVFMRDCAEKNVRSGLREEAHKIKGAAGSFFAPSLYEAAGILETQAAVDGDLNAPLMNLEIQSRRLAEYFQFLREQNLW